MIIQAHVTNHQYKIMTDKVLLCLHSQGNFCAFGKRWIETKQNWSKERWFHFREYTTMENEK